MKSLKSIIVEMQNINKLKTLLPTLARAAQKCYDDWDINKFDDPLGFDTEYAGGGICHLIADEFVSILDQHDIEAATATQQIEEQHVFTIAQLDDGVYIVDIPPNTYETGAAYSWERKPDIKIDANDIYIDKISNNPEEFEEFIDS